jgi:hypothetical protein
MIMFWRQAPAYFFRSLLRMVLLPANNSREQTVSGRKGQVGMTGPQLAAG